jgi:hypothetical protein
MAPMVAAGGSPVPPPRGHRSWRVRYRRDDGTIGALHGFTTNTAASEQANTL